MARFTPLIRVSEIVDASPSRVWKTATRKTGLMFMGADVKTDWRIGHPITFKGEWKGKRFEDKGQVETFDEQRKLAFTHFSPMPGKPEPLKTTISSRSSSLRTATRPMSP